MVMGWSNNSVGDLERHNEVDCQWGCIYTLHVQSQLKSWVSLMGIVKDILTIIISWHNRTYRFEMNASERIWVNVKIRQNSCPFHILWKPLMWSWFFFFTQYYWSYLIRQADKTEIYWCVNIFFIGLKPHFLAFLPVQRKKLNFQQELLKKLLFSQEF